MRTARLHPFKIVTGAAAPAWIGGPKRFVVRRLYSYLARAYPVPDWTTMNYGYAPAANAEEAPGVAAFQERYSLNLYWRVATAGAHGADWTGLDVLEIGSGRGGGAAYLSRQLRPKRYLGLDFAPEAVALAAKTHAGVDRLAFDVGDAENLPLPDAAFDLAINIESAHCYASVPRFLRETARVLRPGGALLFAAFAAAGEARERLEAQLRASPFVVSKLDDITARVAAALDADEKRKQAFVDAHVKGWFKSFAVGAYALEGSPMRQALKSGATRYLAAVLTKP